MPRRRGLAFLLIASFLAISLPLSAQGQTAPPAESEASAANLARSAKATASESQDDLTPEKAIDGNRDTRWSGIPGHNSGVWFQLDWDQPVTLGEVIIRQFDRFVMELDVQVWDAARNDWRTAEHFGKPGTRLPGVVLCRFAPLQTARGGRRRCRWLRR